MVRVAGLREQAFGDMLPQDSAGRRPASRSRSCSGSRSGPSSWSRSSTRCWNESIVPALAEQGIRISRDERARRRSSAKSLDKYLPPAGVSRCSRRWRSTPAIPARGSTTAGCTWRRCCERHQRPRARSELFAVVQVPQVLPRFVLGRAGRQAELRAAGRPDRQPAAGTVRRLSRSSTTRRSASRATWTSTCWSRRPTTCCGSIEVAAARPAADRGRAAGSSAGHEPRPAQHARRARRSCTTNELVGGEQYNEVYASTARST